MGDLRFERPYVRLLEADDPASEVRSMGDEDLIAALAVASGSQDAFLANVLATEAQNRARRARAIAEHIGEGIYAIDRTGRVTYLNPEAERLLGVSARDAMGEDVANVVHRVDRDGLRVKRSDYPSLVALATGSTVKRIDSLVRRRDGGVRSVLCTAAPIRVDHEVTGAVVSMRDDTERRADDAALRLRDRLLEAAGEAIVAVHPDGHLMYANPAAVALFRWDPGAPGRRDVASAFAEAPRIVETFAAQADWSGTVTFDREDEPLSVQFTLRRVTDEGGRLVALVGLATDITQRMEEARALRESDLRWRRLVASAPVILWATDAQGIVTLSEGSALAKAGIEPGALVGKHFDDIVTDYPNAPANLRRALAGEEFEVVAEYGGRHLETRYAPMRSEDGAVIGVIGVSVDVTERVRTEASLRESEERFRLAGKAAADTLWDYDIERHRIWRGEPFARIFGYEHVPDTPEAWEALVHPQDLPRIRAEVEHALADPSTDLHQFEYRFRRADGSWADVVDRAFVVRRDDGTPTRLVGAMIDATARRHELRHRELEERHRELEAFSYSVSHDIRARLRGIEYFTQVLLEDQGARLDDEGRGYVRRVREEAARLNAFVQDLLRFASVARETVTRRVVDVSRLASTVVQDLRAPEPGRRVEVAIEPDLVINADPGLVRVVFENLLGNAWKYTRREEHPRIAVSRATWPDGRVAIAVSDNGAGFDPAQAARLFKPFERLHGAEYDGTGLGLATVARIVRRHGGDIRAKGRPGEGATFTFTLEPSA
ncbi:MAG TPA: PAS domain S-box protein [Candidatus Thermoplasmatota archaeon]|nr:PAS domain S-box protein [Candidatus Thermoplasmatota archaeon]